MVPGLFKDWWNTFSDMEDQSTMFSDECVAACDVGPCSDDLDDYEPVDDSSSLDSGAVAGTFLGNYYDALLVHIAIGLCLVAPVVF